MSDFDGFFLSVYWPVSSFDVQRFECDRCGRSYKHRTNLYNHKREECGMPPSYFCPVCNKGFKKKQHMQRHQTVHTNFPPVELAPTGPLLEQLENKFLFPLSFDVLDTYLNK